MFSKFEPLSAKAPDLIPQLERVTVRGGMPIPPDRMFWMLASDKTIYTNAYVTGIGATKRVVIWDTSIAKETTAGWILALRFLINKAMLPMAVVICAQEDQDRPLLTLTRGFTFLRSKVWILNAEHKRIGYFKSKLFSFGGAEPIANAAAELRHPFHPADACDQLRAEQTRVGCLVGQATNGGKPDING